MGMQSSWGAESAAQEILALVAVKKLEYAEHPMALRALKDIEEKAAEIYHTAKSGYY